MCYTLTAMTQKLSAEICEQMNDYDLTCVATLRQVRCVQLFFETGGDWEKAYLKAGYARKAHPGQIQALLKEFLKSPVVQELVKRKKKQIAVTSQITDDFIVTVLHETLEIARAKKDQKTVNKCLMELSKIKAAYALDKASIREKTANATAWAETLNSEKSEKKLSKDGDISQIAELLTFSEEKKGVGLDAIDKALAIDDKDEEKEDSENGQQSINEK